MGALGLLGAEEGWHREAPGRQEDGNPAMSKAASPHIAHFVCSVPQAGGKPEDPAGGPRVAPHGPWDDECPSEPGLLVLQVSMQCLLLQVPGLCTFLKNFIYLLEGERA